MYARKFESEKSGAKRNDREPLRGEENKVPTATIYFPENVSSICHEIKGKKWRG